MALNEQEIRNLITEARLRAFAPKIKASISAALVQDCPKVFSANGIDTPVLIAHFFAQISKETGGLKRLDENLNYTTVARLRQIFKKFQGLSDAEVATYVKKPERLANFVMPTGTETATWAQEMAGPIGAAGSSN